MLINISALLVSAKLTLASSSAPKELPSGATVRSVSRVMITLAPACTNLSRNFKLTARLLSDSLVLLAIAPGLLPPCPGSTTITLPFNTPLFCIGIGFVTGGVKGEITTGGVVDELVVALLLTTFRIGPKILSDSK